MGNLHTQIIDYLLTQSWQIGVLAMAIAAVSLAVKNKSAHVRYLLWLIVLAKCLVPPLYTITLAVLPRQQTPEPVVNTAVEIPAVAVMVEAVPTEPVTLPSRTVLAPPVEPSIAERLGEVTFRQWLAFVWIVGVGVFVLAAVIKALRVNQWLRRERRALPAKLQSEIEKLFAELGVKTVPKVWLVEGIGQPFVWGLLRGSIYLPGNFVGVTGDESRRGVLGHELSHILRFDAAVNLLQIIAQGIFWFHPFVWWANKKIRAEREKCCDEMAIARLGARAKDYSRAIVNTLIAEHEVAWPIPSLAVAGPVKNIEDRIKTIMNPRKKFYQRPSFVTIVAVLLLAAVAVPTTLALTRRAAKESIVTDDGQAWGTAIEGVQCRLRTDGGKWQAGETPALKADIRNRGTHQLYVVQHQGLCELWRDGRWHSWAGEVRAKSSPLGPGREYNDIPILLDEHWVSKSNGKPLRLRRRHIVRVAFITESEQGEVIRVHSNPVEIEILPKEMGSDSSIRGAEREAAARRVGVGSFRRRISFIGLDLTDAPRTTNQADLPDLFEERSVGSGSYALRDEVVAARHPEFWEEGVVYYVAEKKQFYIIEEPGHPGSGSKTFYGPFAGEPWKRFGMAEPRPVKKQYRFAIYLVVDPVVVAHQFDGDEPDEVAALEQLRLGSVPVLTEEDIVEYDWNEHFLKLTPEAWKRVPSPRSVWGLPFVVVADGQRCYLGAFWAHLSSYMPKVPFIGGFRPGWRENKIQISPPEPIAGMKDPRNDPQVRKVLEELGIAGEPAWGEAVDGLQLGLAFDGEVRPYRQGELVGFKVYVRNLGDKEVPLAYDDLGHSAPGLQGIAEKPMIFNAYISGGRATRREYRLLLRPSELKMLGKVQLQIEPTTTDRQVRHSAELEPGTYPVRQTVKFGGGAYDSWRGKLTSGKLEFVVEAGAKPAWGEPVDGVRCRLRATKRVWKLGERPTFSLDVRNYGDNPIRVDFSGSRPRYEIEYDGRWYGYTGRGIIRGSLYVMDLAPGEEISDAVGVDFPGVWVTPVPPNDGKPDLFISRIREEPQKLLDFSPGTHEVRVRLYPRRHTQDRGTGVVSNPVQIEILPWGGTAGKGEAVREKPSVWLTVLPKSPIRSLNEYEHWIRTDPRPTAPLYKPVPIPACDFEIRRVSDQQRVARIPLGESFGGTGELTQSARRRFGWLGNGEYLVALCIGYWRCSNVSRLTLDSDFDGSVEPTLSLVSLEAAPGGKLSFLGIRAVGPTPQDAKLTNETIAFPKLVVDGVERNLKTLKWAGPVAPLESGKIYTRILDLDGYEPAIEPGKEHTVKAIVGKYESVSVAIPADNLLGQQWDIATKKLPPVPPPRIVLEGKVTGLEGKVAEGYQVSLSNLSGSVFKESTKQDGTYQFINVPPGKYSLVCHLKGKGMPDLEIENVQIHEGETLTVDMSLHRKYILSGTVSYEDGRPAANIGVWLTCEDRENHAEFNDYIATDANGGYELGGPFGTVSYIGVKGKRIEGQMPLLKLNGTKLDLVLVKNEHDRYVAFPRTPDRKGSTRSEILIIKEMDPLEFISHLQKLEAGTYEVIGVPRGWVKEAYVGSLIELLDSDQRCSSVAWGPSSPHVDLGKPSTVGREAGFLIQSFRGKQSYPPPLEAKLSETDKAELRQWWKEYSKKKE